MKRHDQEIFGIVDTALAMASNPIFEAAYEDSVIQNTNDGFRTGYTPEESPMCPYEKVMARRHLLNRS